VRVEQFLDLLGRHPESGLEAFNIGRPFGRLEGTENVVENRKDVPEQVHFPIPQGILVFPSGTLAEVVEFGLRSQQPVLGVLEPRLRRRRIVSTGFGLAPLPTPGVLAAFGVGFWCPIFVSFDAHQVFSSVP
jgi:hypothetical protein